MSFALQKITKAIVIGALAQLGERLICIQEVRSSILLGSTNRTLRSKGSAYHFNKWSSDTKDKSDDDWIVKHC